MLSLLQMLDNINDIDQDPSLQPFLFRHFFKEAHTPHLQFPFHTPCP